jgi:beta-mannosidase
MTSLLGHGRPPADLSDLAWQLIRTDPDAAAGPDQLDASAKWLPAQVPGTAGGALLAAGQWDGIAPLDTDASDWWWRATLPADLAGPATLEFDGVATVAEVWIAGRLAARSDGMFARFTAEVDVPAGGAELYLVVRALGPLLAQRRPRPQWKTRLVRQQNLRWYRTTLLGRMPGWSPTGAPAGPWRPIRLWPHGPSRADRITARRIDVRCAGTGGVVDAAVSLNGAGLPASARLQVSHHGELVGESPLDVQAQSDLGQFAVTGAVELHRVERWWPHGYGAQPLYQLTLQLDDRTVELGRVGFREFAVDREHGAFQPMVNGVPVFARGACWVRPGGVSLQAGDEQIRAAVQAARDGGLVMLRVTGTTVYEQDAFWNACDELGILVWQDAMIANLPPPEEPEFVSALVAELRQVLGEVSGRPALAVVSGGSEVEQQAAMLGLPADKRALPVLEQTIPTLVRELTPGAVYVTSSPTGGEPPFRPDRGVAHYFGVGAYLRPLTDARLTGVRFAAECLAFANPPEQWSVEESFGSAAAAGHTPEWKRGIPRDAGAPWDFEDVRDVYVEMLFGVDARRVRFTDPDRYLDLGRAAVAYAIERTMAGWRDRASGCGGALVLNFADLTPGAGWGLLDSAGRPKSAWYAFRRAAAPLAVHIADQGMNGLGIRVWNDAPAPVPATLEVTLYAGGETAVGSAAREVLVPARGELSCEVEEVLGAFRDAGWAYRFGPPSADVVRAVVHTDDGRQVSDLHFPSGLAGTAEPDVGLTADVVHADADTARFRVASRRAAQFVAFDVTGWVPDDAWFHLAPGESREVRLTRRDGRATSRGPRGEVRALNSLAHAGLH